MMHYLNPLKYGRQQKRGLYLKRKDLNEFPKYEIWIGKLVDASDRKIIITMTTKDGKEKSIDVPEDTQRPSDFRLSRYKGEKIAILIREDKKTGECYLDDFWIQPTD